MIGMKENAFIDVKNRSSSITAELESGGSGVILAQGGSHSGWSLYVKDGRPAFAYNFLGAVTTISASERLPAGPVTVTYDFAYEGGGKPGAGGTGTLSINGKQVGSGRIERTIPFIYGVETADVGMDLYSPVTTDYAKGDNAVHRNDQEGDHRREVDKALAKCALGAGVFDDDAGAVAGRQCLMAVRSRGNAHIRTSGLPLADRAGSLNIRMPKRFRLSAVTRGAAAAVLAAVVSHFHAPALAQSADILERTTEQTTRAEEERAKREAKAITARP